VSQVQPIVGQPPQQPGAEVLPITGQGTVMSIVMAFGLALALVAVGLYIRLAVHRYLRRKRENW
jgi:LPXTG-motif cell wall-anchored protein